MIDIKKKSHDLTIKPVNENAPQQPEFKDNVIFNVEKRPANKQVPKPVANKPMQESQPNTENRLKPNKPENPIQYPEGVLPEGTFDSDGYLVKYTKKSIKNRTFIRDKRYMRPKKEMYAHLKKARDKYNQLRIQQKQQLEAQELIEAQKEIEELEMKSQAFNTISEPTYHPVRHQPNDAPVQVLKKQVHQYTTPANDGNTYLTKANFFSLMNEWTNNQRKNIRAQQQQRAMLAKKREQERKQKQISLGLPNKNPITTNKPYNVYSHFFN